MLKYSANNQTFYRSKTQSHKWLNFTLKLEPISSKMPKLSPAA
jgi:hypothetical protein